MRKFLGEKFSSGLKVIYRPWIFPIILFLVGLATYGIILTKPGFYWDDWGKVYLYYTHNPIVSFHYSPSRPFTIWSYLFLFTFAKMTPIVWQLVVLILRWLGISAIYYTLTSSWPKLIWQFRWVGVLMFVFPGFLSQPVSVAYSDQLLVFLVFAISLYLTVQAIRSKKRFWLWMPISVVLGIVQMFLIEYFVLLEIVRPLVIWSILRSQGIGKKEALKKALLYWVPFVVGLIGFVCFRLIYIPAILPTDPNSAVLVGILLHSPLTGMKTLFTLFLKDSVNLLLSIWAGTLTFQRLSIVGSKIAMIAWSMGIVVTILFSLYNRRPDPDEKVAGENYFIPILVLGGVAMLMGALPVWATNRFIVADKWSDRFTLGPMLGVVILVVFIIDWLFRTRNQKQWLFAILLAACISLQVINTNDFRLDWGIQKNMYWQMAWRIPTLKPGTAIIGSGTFTDKSSYYEGSYIVNLLFSNRLGVNAEYGYFDVWHLSESSYKPNQVLSDKLQGSSFIGNTSQAIGMYFNINNPSECIRILDPIYSEDPKFSALIRNIIPISDLNNIQTGDGSKSPNPAIFGMEPSHDWCYFFEKADLARQMKDWNTILSLGSNAKTKNLSPASGSEYLPFIEAFAQTGQWSKAYDLSLAAQKISTKLDGLFCNNWSRFQKINGGEQRDAILSKATTEFCTKSTH
jgi:hypothetical protein